MRIVSATVVPAQNVRKLATSRPGEPPLQTRVCSLSESRWELMQGHEPCATCSPAELLRGVATALVEAVYRPDDRRHKDPSWATVVD